MKELIITGCTEEDFLKNNRDESFRCCYGCEAIEGKRVAIIDEKGVLFVEIQLMPLSIAIMDSDLVAKYFLCQFCYPLRNSLGRNIRVIERQDFN